MNKFSHLVKCCDHAILMASLGLSLAGLLTLASITRNNSAFPSREVLIQSAALLLGLSAAAVVLMQGYRYFINLEKIIYIISLLFLMTVYIPGLGAIFYGSRSWIDLGFITIQPSEPVKIAFVILMASYLSKPGRTLADVGGIVKASLYGLPFILIVAKEDFGSGCVFCAIWFFMVFCSDLDMKFLWRAALVLIVLLPMFYFFLAGYQKDRIDAFLAPDNLDLPGNYQVWNSKVSIGSGGFYGKGYMQGTQSILGFLPVPESDFIFSSAVEETGFVGGVTILVLFGVFLYRSMKAAKYAKDLQGTLTAVGLTGMFFFQAFENIAMTMGMMPVTGITLPFMSYGGSAMFSAMTGTGFLLSVSTRQKI